VKSNPNSCALRVAFHTNYLVELTSSYHLGATNFHIAPNKLPEFITKSVALLKMLSDGGRVENVGKKFRDNMYYVFVDVDLWKAFVADSYADFLVIEGEENEL